MKVLTAPVRAVGSLLKKPKIPQLPAAQPVAQRDDAAAATAMDDELRKRRGAAANMLFGAAGVEAGAGATSAKALMGI